MKKEVAKMIRATACDRLGNHEYKLIRKDKLLNIFLYECLHCKMWYKTMQELTPDDLEFYKNKWRADQKDLSHNA